MVERSGQKKSFRLKISTRSCNPSSRNLLLLVVQLNLLQHRWLPCLVAQRCGNAISSCAASGWRSGRSGPLFPACQRQNLKHWTKGLHLKQDPNARSEKDAPPSFELDVVALRGHQLFLFSCIATEGMERTTDNPAAGDRSEAKKHLFEAYMRARQVGGDEARVALVSCVARPDTLKAEVVHEWDAEGKIEVFGREHLETLSTHIGAWFSKANQQ